MKLIHFLLPYMAIAILIGSGCTNEPITRATSPDGVEINFSTQGKGKPAIILIHGWTNSMAIWDETVPALAEQYKVIAVELAGHGESGKNRSEWTISAFGDDVVSVVNALKLKEIVLVGFSMGGAVVVDAANKLPDQALGVILVDNMHNVEEVAPPEMFPYIDSVMMSMMANMSMETLIAAGFFREPNEEYWTRLQAMYEGATGEGWSESLMGALQWDYEHCRDELNRLDVPVIAINAEQPPTAVETNSKYISSYEAKIIPNTGHVMMWEAKEEFNRLLDESIREILATK
jgi:pimeloyl-ACP methyl ester carboxylesterase